MAIGVVGAPGDARHGLDVLRRARLFDEEQIQRLDFLDDDRGDAGAGLGVEIDADVDVGAEDLRGAAAAHLIARSILAWVSIHS